MKEILNKFITLSVYISKRNQNLYLVWQIIKIFNVLIVLFKFLEKILIATFSKTIFYVSLQALYRVMSGLNPDGTVITEIGYTTAVMLILLCGCLTHYFRSNIDLVSRAKRTYLVLFIVHYPLLVLLVVELFYTSNVLYLVHCFSTGHEHNYSVDFYVSAAMTAVLVLLVTLFNYQHRIFSLLFPFILIFVSLLESLPASIFILLFSIPFAYQSKQPIDRCSYVFFSIVSVFNVMEHFDETKKISSFIYLMFCLFLVCVAMIAQETVRCDVICEVENNRFLMECVSKLDKNEVGNLGNMRLTKIEAIFRKFYENHWMEIPLGIDFPVNYQIKLLQYESLLKLIDFKLQYTSLKNFHSIELKKQYLQFRIQNSFKINESISQISQFVDYGQNEHKLTYKQKYTKKYVEFVVFDEFFSKQSENEKIEDVKELSQIQEQFIDESVKLIVDMGSFWDEINMDVLIQEMIEENFYQVIVGVENVKKLLKKLKKGYKATWQSKIFQMISKLAYPNHQQRLSAQPQSQLSKTKEDTLYYFVIRNRSIVDVSSSFLKVINSTKYQIVGSQISRIIPKEIVDTVKQRESQAIISAKASNIIPIVCNDYLIKVYEANVKLQPKANSGIEFFYFLKNVEKEQKRAYLYLSSIDLRIQYVSQQFFEILVLNRRELQKKIEKKTLFLNNILTSIDQNLIISELKQKKAIKCQFSTDTITTKLQAGQPSKFNGIATLQNIFDKYVLISLNIISSGETKNHLFLKSRKNILFKAGMFQNKTMQSDFLIKKYQNNKYKYRKNKQRNEHKDPDQHDQNIFCPIENPYKQKIQEKQSEISDEDSSTINYTKCAIILSVILVLVLIFNAVVLMAYCEQQNISIGQTIEAYKKAAIYANSLIHGTYEVYTQYIFSDRKQILQDHINNLHPQAKISKYLEQKYHYIHKVLTEFQQAFTGFYKRKIFASSKYQIVHKYFTAETDLSKASLVEYAYNIKLASQRIRLQFQQSEKSNQTYNDISLYDENPLEFFINNYATISTISAPFDSIEELFGVYFTELNIFVTMIGSVCFGGLVMFYFVIHMVKKNLETVRAIFQIFGFASSNQIEKIFQQIQNGLKLYANQIPKDSLKKLADLNKAKERTMVVYNSKARSSRKKAKLQECKEEEELLKSKLIASNKNMPYFSAVSKMKGYFLVAFLFFSTLGGFFYKMQVDLRQDRVNLTYYSQIEKLIYRETKNSADMFHYNIMATVFNKSAVPLSEIRSKRSAVDKFLSEEFKSSFSQFYKQLREAQTKNLCQVEIDQVYLNNFLKCQDIGLGILEKGYLQTSEYYDFKTEKLKRNVIGLTEIDSSEKYMDLLIHIYVRQKLIRQLKQYRVSIDQNRQQLQVKYRKNMMGFGTGFAVLGIAFVLYLALDFVPTLIKIRKTGIGYFRILPKEVIAKIKISAYINQNNLLKRVTML